MSDQNLERLPTPQPGSIRQLLTQDKIKARFEEVLKDRAPQFIATLATLVYQDKQLSEADPNSVIAAALTAAAYDLSIHPALGQAGIIAYWDNKAKRQLARFQLMYKGLTQLALRTNQYKTLHVTEVYEGEITFDRLTGKVKQGERKNDVIAGYLAYLQLLNGFEKWVYWPTEKIMAHAEKYSKSYNKDYSPWKTNTDAMCRKTVLLDLLRHWGVLSIEMRQAITDADEPTPIDWTQPEPAPDYPDEEIDKALTPEQVKAGQEALFPTQ